MPGVSWTLDISDTFHLSGEAKQPPDSRSTTKELGSRLAAVLCSAPLVGVVDGLDLLRSRVLGLYNYISSTVARWERAAKSTGLWFLRRALSIAACPFLVHQAASRLVTSWRGSLDMQLALWKRFLWKNPRFGLLVACMYTLCSPSILCYCGHSILGLLWHHIQCPLPQSFAL